MARRLSVGMSTTLNSTARIDIGPVKAVTLEDVPVSFLLLFVHNSLYAWSFDVQLWRDWTAPTAPNFTVIGTKPRVFPTQRWI